MITDHQSPFVMPRKRGSRQEYVTVSKFDASLGLDTFFEDVFTALSSKCTAKIYPRNKHSGEEVAILEVMARLQQIIDVN
jgi:hypothetical protein